MRGISRASLAGVQDRLNSLTAPPADAAALGDELFAVAGLFSRQSALRRALSDPSRPADTRAALATGLLSGKVSSGTTELISTVAAARWSGQGDLLDAIEHLAAEAIVTAAEQANRLDDLEDELFRFGRIVAAQPSLRAALTNPFTPAAGKQQLLNQLLSGKVTPETLRLVTQAAVNPLGRRLDASLESYARIAAERRERLVAEVHVAAPLSEEQRGRLAAALAAAYGHQVHLNIVLDQKVAAGLTVRIGDELIDGSVATRLAEVRRRLAG